MEIQTPRGKIVHVTLSNGTVKVELKWSTGFQSAAEAKLARGGELQQYIDSMVLKDTTPFVPMRTGMLYKSGILHSIIGDGCLKWQTPYARKMYYTPLNFDTSRHPQAGMKWCERSKSQNLQKWKIAVESKARAGGFS